MIFFFSSRRRHTRFDCDWSSDVCSSDLSERPAYEETECGAAQAAPGRRAADRADEAETEVDEEPRPHAGPHLPSDHDGPFHQAHTRCVPAEQPRPAAAQVHDGLERLTAVP